jgi:hypothetical protein
MGRPIGCAPWQAMDLDEVSSADVDAGQVVPGDVLVLETGDPVAPAVRLLAEDALPIDESPPHGRVGTGAIPASRQRVGRQGSPVPGRVPCSSWFYRLSQVWCWC